MDSVKVTIQLKSAVFTADVLNLILHDAVPTSVVSTRAVSTGAVSTYSNFGLYTHK